MISYEEVYNGDYRITAKLFRPAAPLAAVQILHGMAEHMGRYDEFCTWLMANDIFVIIHDHRGHGAEAENPGHFERFDDLTEDALMVRTLIPEHLKTFITGHSMGSIAARRLLAEPVYDGGIIIGTGSKKGLSNAILSRVMSGAKHFIPEVTGDWLTRLAFFGYDGRFPEEEHNRWLCSDMEVVRDFNADQLCGRNMTFNALAEIVTNIREVDGNAILKRYQPDIPILLIGGKEDPFSGFGEDIRALGKKMARHTDSVTVQLYEKSRHEVLHEKNREQVYQKLLEWVMSHVDQ